MRGWSSCRCRPNSSTVEARILGTDVTYKLGAPGRHLVMNSLAVLAAATLAGVADSQTTKQTYHIGNQHEFVKHPP